MALVRERPPLVREFSAKFEDIEGVFRGQRSGSLRPYSWFSRLELLFFSIKYILSCTHEAEWRPFQTHYFSENLLAAESEPGPLDL
jgi:hypothetical protein